MNESIDVTTVAAGIARLAWSHEHTIDDVRREVAAALREHVRVETWVDPDDHTAQRMATWSGMHREGVMRGVSVDDLAVDRIVYARLVTDAPLDEPGGFRSLLNSFLPRKRAISQMLIRDSAGPAGRVLLCQLTYKTDWDLPGGVVEVGESPRVAVGREVEEELGLVISAGDLLLTDWLPPWGGWDDAVCLVFDGGVHDPAIVEKIVKQEREIRDAQFCDVEQVRAYAADFTARRIAAAVAGTSAYTESGHGGADA